MGVAIHPPHHQKKIIGYFFCQMQEEVIYIGTSTEANLWGELRGPSRTDCFCIRIGIFLEITR